MIVKFSGILSKVDPPRNFKSGDGQFQRFFVTRKAPTDATGQKIGKDQTYEVVQFNKDIKSYDLAAMIGRPIEIEAYLNSNEFTTDRGLQYQLQLKLRKKLVHERREVSHG